MSCKELTLNGLKYQDQETGEQKNIPRFEDNSGYKYSERDKEIKDALFMNCKLRYPNVDPYVLEILIDYWLNHPEKMKEDVEKEWDSGFDPEALQKQNKLNEAWKEFSEEEKIESK
tara:strand:+ start:4433 stop:4780 length:348 start_codon:yes stop_codon:yes gene_type:complete